VNIIGIGKDSAVIEQAAESALSKLVGKPRQIVIAELINHDANH
jgi:hypothetical protein